ncbi:unnamed protein product [Rotaria socialis]|uniref:Uncharacterized protein n=1 Tax=Rotaria socialis TaxID=392032 RepID=A0A821P6G9_9BILA|nr:unnamed protein product [Rotaria socialis]CAF4796246.1 unnamed protein product [Rotaria socialis]
MDEHGFYVSLNASASLSLYPNNTLASFSNDLHSPIDFANEEWVVGLAEVLINAGVVNIGIDDSKFSVHRLMLPTDSYVSNGEAFTKVLTYHFEIPAKHYMTVTDLVKAINNQLHSNLQTADLLLGVSTPKEGKQLTLLHIKTDENLVTKQTETTRKKTSFTFTSHVASLLGFGNKTTVNFNDINCTSTEMTISGIIPKFAYVYMDIIWPQFFGDSMMRLLRAVLLKPQTKEEKKHRLVNAITYDPVHYVRVENNYISAIKTDIRTLDGSQYPFSPGSLSLKLHFKRIT